MSPSLVARFFREMARHVAVPVRVVLTGGAAAVIQGRARATQDVDFEARMVSGGRARRARKALVAAIDRARLATGVAAQFSEEMGRWSSISLGDYRAHTRLWRRFGRVSVYLLEPSYFAIGKLARGTAADLSDIRAVFRAEPVPWERAARVWGKALRRSPLSNALPLFARQVEQFFMQDGPALWGRRFNPREAVAVFRRAAGGGSTG